MGVKYLWDIIEEAKRKETLDCLRGKILCVDLSIWIVEAIKALQFKTSVLKPHLRNMFFRVVSLRRLGVKLIFVTEGEPPELKQETMKQRNIGRYGVKCNTKRKVGRSRFQRTINECCRLLDILGIPHVRATGEAEAMCAVLNKHGFVDGCFTNDGDFFLYGGQIVYRDLGIDPKDPYVLKYTIDDIKSRTGLNQRDMVGLALVNGCDYTNGIVGVGKGTVTKFLEEKSFSEDLIQRLKAWYRKDFFEEEIVGKSEATIAKKALKTNDFLNQKILDEYLIEKDKLDGIKKKLRWKYPDIKVLQQFLLDNLEWPFEYTLNKVLQLASSTYLEKLSDGTFYEVPISPESVVKTRCQYGVALVEMEWKMEINDDVTYSSKWENCPASFITQENQQVVLKVLPGIIEEFLERKTQKKSSRKSKKKFYKANPADFTKITSTEIPHATAEVTESSSRVAPRDNIEELCDRLQDLTPNDCTETTNQETSPGYSEDSDDEIVLPLSQRILKMAAPKDLENVNGEESVNICIESLADTHAVKEKKEKESSLQICENYSCRDKSVKMNNLLRRFHIQETPKKSQNVNNLAHTERTPFCLDIDTPPPLESTPHAIQLYSDTSVKKKVSNVFKDVTNFSNLGDSLLCHSLELCEGMNFSANVSNCKVDNEALKTKSIKATNFDGGDDEFIFTSPENSPMCLTERIKLRQATQKC